MEPIVIRRSGNLLEFPGVPFLNQLNLVYLHKIMYRGRELKDRQTYKALHPESGINPAMDFVPRKLYRVVDNQVLCAAGLLTRICNTFNQLKVPRVFQDLREPAPEPKLERLAEIPNLQLRHRQDEVLAAIIASDGGVVTCATGYGKTKIVELLRVIYPTSRIAVISPGLDLLKSTYDRLNIAGDVGRIGGGYCELDKRVLLCSANSIHKLPLSKMHLVLYDEVHTCGTDDKIRALSRVYTDAKFIGFSASYPGRIDGADAMVEAIFGPILIDICYQEASEHNSVVPIVVQMIDIPPFDSYQSAEGDYFKRNAYWRNTFRNQRLAQVLNAFPEHIQRLAMVETVDHAYELRRFLPDYPLVYGSRNDSSSLIKRQLMDAGEAELSSKDREALRRQFETGTLKKAIATHCWKAGVDFVNLQVMLRADGGNTPVSNTQLPGRLSRLADGKECGLLLDAMDRFDPKAHARSLDRVRFYRKMGWQVKL